MPDSDVGVVLGTSKYTENGKPSPEFRGRIEAAAELYKNGELALAFSVFASLFSFTIAPMFGQLRTHGAVEL